MSAIEKQLLDATGVTQKRGEDPQEYFKRIVRAVGGLTDAQWNGLTTPAQDWYNAAADAMNEKKPIGGFAAEETAPAVRRAASGDAPAAAAASADPGVGDTVLITDHRDNEIQGEVVAITADKITIKEDKDSDAEDFARKRIKGVKVVKKAAEGTAATTDAPAAKPADKPAAAAPAQRRAPAAASKAETKPETKAETKADTKPADRAAAPKSASQRIREIVCGDPTLTTDAISKLLTAESFEAKNATIDLVRADTVKTIEVLRGLGKLK